MKLNLYAVFDSVAGMHLTPFVAQNHGVAVRSFGDQCGNPNSPFHIHPDNYILFHIGTYDLQSARVENCERAERLGTAMDFKPVLPMVQQ